MLDEVRGAVYGAGRDLKRVASPVINAADKVGDFATDWVTDKALFLRDRAKELPKAAPELVKHPVQAGKTIAKGFSQTGDELVQGLNSLSKIPYSVGNAIGEGIANKYPKFTDVVSSALYPVGWLSNKRDAMEEAHPWTGYVTRPLVTNPFSNQQPLLAEGSNKLNDWMQYSDTMDTTDLSREAELLGRTTGGAANFAVQALIPGLGVPMQAYKKGVTPLAFLAAMGKDMGMNAAFENRDTFAGSDRVDSDRAAMEAMREVAREQVEPQYVQDLYNERKAQNTGTYVNDADRQYGLAWAQAQVKRGLGESVLNGELDRETYQELIKDPALIRGLADWGSRLANNFEPGKPRPGWEYATEQLTNAPIMDKLSLVLDEMDLQQQRAIADASNPANWDEAEMRNRIDAYLRNNITPADREALKRYTYNGY